MRDYRALKFLDFFRFIFVRFGIDYEVMRRILAAKLTMDQRRAPTIFNNNKKKEGNQFLKSLGIYALYGLVLIPALFVGDSYIFMMSIVFGIAMFILMTSMIADFSSVLLDVRDKNILNTKPVAARTVSAAKVVHVGIYMVLLTGAFVGVPSIVMLVQHGVLFFLLFLIILVLLVLFIIALTALVYIFILQFFSGERLKDIINYVQILLSAGIFIGYQVLIRAFDFVDFNYVYDFSWWHVFIPPLWFGAPFELLLHGNMSASLISLSVMALVIPACSIYLYYRMMPAFERNLEKLMESRGSGRKKRFNLGDHLENLLCFRREERIMFRFSWQMMKQEREFKLKIYPSLGIAIVFPFIFIFNQLNMSSWSEMAAGKTYLTIYFSSMMVAFIAPMLRYSASAKGSWIFHAAPIRETGALYSAALKASLMKLYVPIYLLLSVIFVAIFSWRIIPDLFVVFAGTLLLALAAYRVMNGETYPFSEVFQAAQNADTMKNFLIMFAAGGLALIHFLSLQIPYGVYIYLIILLLAVMVGWRTTFYSKNQPAQEPPVK
jgi:hypothetical protein